MESVECRNISWKYSFTCLSMFSNNKPAVKKNVISSETGLSLLEVKLKLMTHMLDIDLPHSPKPFPWSQHTLPTHTSWVLSSRTLCSAGVRGSRQEVKTGPWESLDEPEAPLLSLLGRARTCPRRPSSRGQGRVPVLLLPSAATRQTHTPPRTTRLQSISDLTPRQFKLTNKTSEGDGWRLWHRLVTVRSEGKWRWEVPARVINIKSAEWVGASSASRCFCPDPGDLSRREDVQRGGGKNSPCGYVY